MSIISISGRMGSGKDLVGKIIQNLTAFPQDSVDECVKMIENGYFSNAKWEIKRFSGKLKQIASILLNIPVEKFEDREFKELILGKEWGTIKENPINSIPGFENVDFIHLITVREFLQKIGTECFRDGLHKNTWVNALFSDYKTKWVPTGDSVAEEDVSLEKEYPNWIITDTRFPNELEAVKERGGITIRVNRVVEKNHSTHISETSLDDSEFNHVIDNSGTIYELVEKVKIILQEENII